MQAPWPKEYPPGRLIEEKSRHLTLAFLGNIPYPELAPHLSSFPIPHFKFSPCGICDKLLFLPTDAPRVVSAHVKWLYKAGQLIAFQKNLLQWLKTLQLKVDERELLSHVTIARAPFMEQEWEDAFKTFPIVLSAIHLYESIGNLTYQPLWSYPFLKPFEELDHTADIAFHIQAEDIQQLHLHAQMALCFKFPALTPYLTKDLASSLDDIIIDLNAMVAISDQEIGCPFKAVSFHGSIQKDHQGILHWEMIVDV